jgi:RNA polymerase sigma-70 factor (ECF subfamily)
VAANPTLVRERPATARAESAADGAALLYEQYYDRVFGYCLYHLGSREEAEDVAQTTFMWAFRGLRRGVVPRAEASWLFTIAQNACRARHRARGRKRDREVLSDPVVLADVSPAHIADADELIGLEDALARMPELQRRAILLREWRGLSYKEIAAELQLSDAAVETLIFRARRSLAELLAGKPAPKRARRFAFDFGSIAAACKAFLGTGTAAKVAAFIAAAVVATTLAGSNERAPKTGEPGSARLPVAGARHLATPAKTKANAHARQRPKQSREVPSAAPVPKPAPSDPTPLPTVKAAAEEPLGTLTGTADATIESVEEMVAPVTDTLAPLGVEIP